MFHTTYKRIGLAKFFRDIYRPTVSITRDVASIHPPMYYEGVASSSDISKTDEVIE